MINQENKNNDDRPKQRTLKNVTIKGDPDFINQDTSMENVTIWSGENGNNILDRPMVFGSNNIAPEGALVIGSGNVIGDPRSAFLREIQELSINSNNMEVIKAFLDLSEETKKETPDKSILGKSWNILKNLASVNGLIGLGEKLQHAAPFFGI